MRRQRKYKSQNCISGKVGQYNCNCSRCRMINGKPVTDESEMLAYYESKIYQDKCIEIIKIILSKHIDSNYLQSEIAEEIWYKIKIDILEVV